jgi:hypothetical protein
MASVNLSPIFNAVTNFDQYGNILAGGLIYTYQAGSSTPLATYTSADGTIANTNPIVLGPDGKLPQELWLQSGYYYKFILQSSVAASVDTYDNIGGILTQVPPNPSSIPTGCIIMWSGSIGSIPTGFVLCDGTTPGVPDLRNSFILGAGSAYPVGQSGGSADAIVVSHTHTATVTDPGHLHQVPYVVGSGTGIAAGTGDSIQPDAAQSATSVTGITVTNASTGTSGVGANLPPYYALAYIYKT